MQFSISICMPAASNWIPFHRTQTLQTQFESFPFKYNSYNHMSSMNHTQFIPLGWRFVKMSVEYVSWRATVSAFRLCVLKKKHFLVSQEFIPRPPSSYNFHILNMCFSFAISVECCCSLGMGYVFLSIKMN